MAGRAKIIVGLAILVALSLILAPGALAALHHVQGPASHAGTNGMPSSQARCGCLAVRDLAPGDQGTPRPAPIVSIAETASDILHLPLVVRLTVPPPEPSR